MFVKSEMVCGEEPGGFCQDSWVCLALWRKIGDHILLRNRCFTRMLSGLQIDFLGKEPQKNIEPRVLFTPRKLSPVLIFRLRPPPNSIS